MNKFDDILIYMPEYYKNILYNIKNKNDIQELRLRRGRYINIRIGSHTYYIDKHSNISGRANNECLIMENDVFDEVFFNMCDMSVYTKNDDISNGFITLKNGHRCGVCGSGIVHNGMLTSIKNVSALNIRIANEIIGSGDAVITYIKKHGMKNILILSPPCSGKTTLLRDIVRSISYGALEREYNMSIIDEKGEIAGVIDGIAQNDIGSTVDVFDAYPKDVAIQYALRYFSPDIIILDEICTMDEVRAVIKGENAGVPFIMSMHGDDIKSVYNRPQMKYLLEYSGVDTIIILEGAAKPGIIKKIYERNEIYD